MAPSSNAPQERETMVQVLLEEYSRSRDPRLREELILAHMDLVERIARRFLASGEPLEDLLQEGYIGLINAVDLYDPSKGVKFITYATHSIAGAIQHYLRDRGKLIREPRWLYDLRMRLRRAQEELWQRLEREPTEEELAQHLGLPCHTVRELLQMGRVLEVASLEEAMEGEEDEGGGGLPSWPLEPPDSTMPMEERLALEDALQQLNGLERKVIYSFFFLDMTRSEIARELGYSASYISHLMRRALEKLKRILIGQEMETTRRQLKSMERQLQHLRKEVQRVSSFDRVTHLYNRRYLQERLAEEVARAQRHRLPLAVVMVGVDGWEEYRAFYGVGEGERVLAFIAALFRQNVRRIDVLGRWGGSRFLFILPHTNAQAEVLCERLRRQVEETTFRPRAPSSLKLTLSSGLAVFPEDGEEPRTLIQAAQRAYEEARRQGGNRIVHHAHLGKIP